ncbi:MAG: Hsp20/alpha crystallin family protein [Gammaproteobacteria bacterium]
MAMVRYEPINLFDRFNNEINRFLTGTQAQDETVPARDWMPAVDILEEDSRYVLFADLPGVERSDIDISLEEGVLTIKGERRAESETQADGYRRRERLRGSFLRRFTLPDTVNADSISATMKDGVLQIGIPKQEKPQPRKITVS